MPEEEPALTEQERPHADGRPRHTHPTPADKLRAAMRRVRVAKRVACHVPYRAIAAEEDVSLATIREDVEVVRREWQRRAALAYDEVVAEELAKLDQLEAVWHDRATLEGDQADAEAGRLMIRILDRRAKLLGLDAPSRVEVTGAGGGPVEMSLADRADSLAAEIDAFLAGRAEAKAEEKPVEPTTNGQAH